MSIAALTALASVVVIGLTVFARAEVFRPRVKSAYTTNALVRRMMEAVALACAFAAFELWGYSRPIPDGIAWLLALCAITSSTMLVSMLVHDGRLVVAEVRAADVGAVRDAVREVVPEALDAANARLLDRMTGEPVPGIRSSARATDEPGSSEKRTVRRSARGGTET